METILVVDDEDDIRTVVRKMLEAKGYTVSAPAILSTRCDSPPSSRCTCCSPMS